MQERWRSITFVSHCWCLDLFRRYSRPNCEVV